MLTKLRHSIGKREEKGQGVAVVSQAPFVQSLSLLVLPECSFYF